MVAFATIHQPTIITRPTTTTTPTTITLYPHELARAVGFVILITGGPSVIVLTLLHRRPPSHPMQTALGKGLELKGLNEMNVSELRKLEQNLLTRVCGVPTKWWCAGE